MRLDFKEERDLDFLSSYKLVIKKFGQNAPYLKKDFLLLQTIMQPAKRFYVSEEQSLRVISNMLKEGSSNIKNAVKRLMYEEILLRVQKEKATSEKPLQEIIELVINQPAPRFYLTLESARILHYKLIKKNHK